MLRNLLVLILSVCIVPVPVVPAAELTLPVPGTMVPLSPSYAPPILKGIKVHPENPFKFEFILDQGSYNHRQPGDIVPVGATATPGSVSPGTLPSALAMKSKAPEGTNQSHRSNPQTEAQLKEESTKLIKYFLASLTTPEKDLWVNLSPYEKDRIVPDSFGQTEMGRDLLAQDYILKQITASLIYPEDAIGKKFWQRIYEEAAKRFGSTQVPVNTFNKVWIVPEKAVVYENAKAGTAYVVESSLKVMLAEDYEAQRRSLASKAGGLEEDYLAMGKQGHGAGKSAQPILSSHHPSPGGVAEDKTTLPLVAQTKQSAADIPARMASDIVREVVLPQLTREINQGQNFAQLRQVYNSLILATWYKKKIKDSILNQVYADKNKIKGTEYKTSIIQPMPTRGHDVAPKGSVIVSSSTMPNELVMNSKATQRNQPNAIESPSRLPNEPTNDFESTPGKSHNDVELIYTRYLQAFKKGAYNYIKDEENPLTKTTTPKKYFSGGMNLNMAMRSSIEYISTVKDYPMNNALNPAILSVAFNPQRAGAKPQRTMGELTTAELDFLKGLSEKYALLFDIGDKLFFLSEAYLAYQTQPDQKKVDALMQKLVQERVNDEGIRDLEDSRVEVIFDQEDLRTNQAWVDRWVDIISEVLLKDSHVLDKDERQALRNLRDGVSLENTAKRMGFTQADKFNELMNNARYKIIHYSREYDRKERVLSILTKYKHVFTAQELQILQTMYDGSRIKDLKEVMRSLHILEEAIVLDALVKLGRFKDWAMSTENKTSTIDAPSKNERRLWLQRVVLGLGLAITIDPGILDAVKPVVKPVVRYLRHRLTNQRVIVVGYQHGDPFLQNLFSSWFNQKGEFRSDLTFDDREVIRTHLRMSPERRQFLKNVLERRKEIRKIIRENPEYKLFGVEGRAAIETEDQISGFKTERMRTYVNGLRRSVAILFTGDPLVDSSGIEEIIEYCIAVIFGPYEVLRMENVISADQGYMGIEDMKVHAQQIAVRRAMFMVELQLQYQRSMTSGEREWVINYVHNLKLSANELDEFNSMVNSYIQQGKKGADPVLVKRLNGLKQEFYRLTRRRSEIFAMNIQKIGENTIVFVGDNHTLETAMFLDLLGFKTSQRRIIAVPEAMKTRDYAQLSRRNFSSLIMLALGSQVYAAKSAPAYPLFPVQHLNLELSQTLAAVMKDPEVINNPSARMKAAQEIKEAILQGKAEYDQYRGAFVKLDEFLKKNPKVNMVAFEGSEPGANRTAEGFMNANYFQQAVIKQKAIFDAVTRIFLPNDVKVLWPYIQLLSLNMADYFWLTYAQAKRVKYLPTEEPVLLARAHVIDQEEASARQALQIFVERSNLTSAERDMIEDVLDNVGKTSLANMDEIQANINQRFQAKRVLLTPKEQEKYIAAQRLVVEVLERIKLIIGAKHQNSNARTQYLASQLTKHGPNIAVFGGSAHLKGEGSIEEILGADARVVDLAQTAGLQRLENTGGIDLSGDKINLQSNDSGHSFRFQTTPAQLQEWNDAEGIIPVIINIKPLPLGTAGVRDMKIFLGITS